MAEQLNGHIKIISQQQNELETVFSSMPDGILAIVPDHTIIRISIQNQGPGIDTLHQKGILLSSYRCDKARSREHGGTGLDLLLSNILQTATMAQ